MPLCLRSSCGARTSVRTARLCGAVRTLMCQRGGNKRPRKLRDEVVPVPYPDTANLSEFVQCRSHVCVGT